MTVFIAHKSSSEFKRINELNSEDLVGRYEDIDKIIKQIERINNSSISLIQSFRIGDAISITCLATREKSYSIIRDDINLLREFWLYPLQIVLNKPPRRESDYTDKRFSVIAKEYRKYKNLKIYTKINR